MSSITQSTQTRNQLAASYNIAKLALGGNERVRFSYTASGETTLAAGLVMAKVAATGVLTDLTVAGTNGSQKPIGVLDLGINESITIADGATVQLTFINKGRVAENKLSFPTGVTLASVITEEGLTVKDYLNVLGLVLESGVELTEADNV